MGLQRCCYHNHVFTLGVNNSDLNWRDIATGPLDIYSRSQQSMCINGALYWLPQEGKYQQTLTVFHLNTETFETIAIPECTKGVADLVDICGRPALVTYLDNDSVEQWDVWTMNNHCRGGEKEAWTRKRVLFSTSVTMNGALNYVGTLPTGEMILGPYELSDFPLSIYVYDHLKKKLKSIKIDSYGSRGSSMDNQESGMDEHEIRVCYYEENIITLNCLMNNQQQDQTINTN